MRIVYVCLVSFSLVSVAVAQTGDAVPNEGWTPNESAQISHIESLLPTPSNADVEQQYANTLFNDMWEWESDDTEFSTPNPAQVTVPQKTDPIRFGMLRASYYNAPIAYFISVVYYDAVPIAYHPGTPAPYHGLLEAHVFDPDLINDGSRPELISAGSLGADSPVLSPCPPGTSLAGQLVSNLSIC